MLDNANLLRTIDQLEDAKLALRKGEYDKVGDHLDNLIGKLVLATRDAL